MAHVRAEPYDFEFEPASVALVVIDMQRDFVDPGGFGEALGNDVSLLAQGGAADAARAGRRAARRASSSFTRARAIAPISPTFRPPRRLAEG